MVSDEHVVAGVASVVAPLLPPAGAAALGGGMFLFDVVRTRPRRLASGLKALLRQNRQFLDHESQDLAPGDRAVVEERCVHLLREVDHEPTRGQLLGAARRGYAEFENTLLELADSRRTFLGLGDDALGYRRLIIGAAYQLALTLALESADAARSRIYADRWSVKQITEHIDDVGQKVIDSHHETMDAISQLGAGAVSLPVPDHIIAGFRPRLPRWRVARDEMTAL
ncbi:MAG: hypothetical protein LBI33_05670, partial [Propionibacteriaceae bacterium]|nr:hypothetical protein [Propionibacteriaceae bacterium]